MPSGPPWTARAPRTPLPELLQPQAKLVVLLRHIEKTGGSSLRSSFAASHCQYFGYDFAAPTRTRLLIFLNNFSVYRDLQQKPPNEAFNNHSSSVACAEAHNPAPDAADLVTFRAQYRLARVTRVVLVLMVRRPDDHYRSFFRWSHAPLSVNETSPSFSSRLLRWAPPNLQANIFKHPYRATIAARWCCGQPVHSCCSGSSGHAKMPPTFETGDQFCAEVLSTARAFDAVLPTESISTHGMPVLRQLTGLELPTRHVRVEPGHRSSYTVPPIVFQPDVNLTRMTQEELAQCDWKLHELAQLRFLNEVRSAVPPPVSPTPSRSGTPRLDTAV